MASLTVLSGPLVGRTVLVDAEVFSIGRQGSNDFELPDLSISRRHCVIEAQNDGQATRFYIRDLVSANGMKVNDQDTTGCELRHGDLVQLGDCVLRFDEDRPRVVLSDADVTESTICLPPDEVRRIETGSTPAIMPDSNRYAEDLKALLAISMELGGLRQLPELQARFLQGIISRIPAGYAAIVPILPTGLEESIRRAAQHVSSQYGSSVHAGHMGVSRTVLERVSHTQEAFLAGPVRYQPLMTEAESIVRSGTEAVIAVPAFSDDELVGVVYLASTLPKAFDMHHLRLATAAAGILGIALKRALLAEELERENARLLSRVRIQHQIVGPSAETAKVLTEIQRVCATDTTVLISGDTGTGKELAAQALHSNSPRASRALVAFNCAAFSESLIESELFGHERGAFSGAYGLKRGIFEQAHNSTLFLDEIGELQLPLQAKLLRVLETHEIRRLGGEQSIRVDFRLVAATYRDLGAAVKAGLFRTDLYYRLNVVVIAIHPLRERRSDILPLAEHFLDQFRGKTSRQIEGISPAARVYLERYDWPGNVRELRNAIERAVIAGASPYIEIEDLPDSLAAFPGAGAEPIPFRQSLLDARRKIILAAFQSAQGRHNQAAQLLGVHPNNLHRMLNQLGLRNRVQRPP
jgi:transcriptional regulator with GAF, ATPase, and Fis domain